MDKPAEPGYKGVESSNQSQIIDLLDDDEKNIWSGFVTRNRQHRVCMEAYTVSGDHESFLTD